MLVATQLLLFLIFAGAFSLKQCALGHLLGSFFSISRSSYLRYMGTKQGTIFFHPLPQPGHVRCESGGQNFHLI